MKDTTPFPLKIKDRQTGMYMTNSNDKGGELLGQERRRRWSTDQKLVMVRESLEPGQSVAVVARRNSINAVPASELTDAVKQSRELQRMLGKKTMETEVFKEAVEIAWSRKWIAHSPLLPGDDQ